MNDTTIALDGITVLAGLNDTGKSTFMNSVPAFYADGLIHYGFKMEGLERGELKVNDLLILPEPETHLHPARQVEFIRNLLRVRETCGIKLLLSTYSYYVMQAIEVYAKQFGMEKECRYYLFSKSENGVKVEDVTDYTDKIYETFWEPIKKLKKISAVLENDGEALDAMAEFDDGVEDEETEEYQS